MHKRGFNRSDYELYDAPAKNALVQVLQSQGHTILETKENYWADIKSEKDGFTYYNEAEVKVGWTGDWNTDWKEIRIPERKQRLLDKYQGDHCVLNFYVFRKDLLQCWRIKDTLLTPESLKGAKGRYISKNEKFFHIPFVEAELIKL